MRQMNAEPYFVNENHYPEVFMPGLTHEMIIPILTASCIEAMPLPLVMRLHHDSLCPSEDTGEITLDYLDNNSLATLESCLQRCLCERFDLTMRVDMSDDAIKNRLAELQDGGELQEEL